MITKKQKLVLDFITDYQKRRGYAPILEEIKKKFKLASVSTAHFHVSKLRDLGYLAKEENKPRAIDVVGRESMVKVHLLGTIAAGQPIEAITNRETIAVAKSKIPTSSEVYALRVAGNSMIEENINDGDIILVKSQQTAENGQKVVALIDNQETTLKKFYRERGQIRLQPANKNMEPLIFKNTKDVSIQGIVLDVIKEQKSIPLELPERKEPKKFKEIPLNKFICGDALHYLRQLPDKSVDLIVADPPYNLSKGNNIRFDNQVNKLKGFGGTWNKVMEQWDSMPMADYFDFTIKWVQEAKRVLKPTGSVWVFGTYHNIGIINFIFQSLGIEIINEVVWYKRNAFPNLAGRRFTASHETLLWGHAGNEKRQYYFDYKQSKSFSSPSDLLKTQGKQMRTVWDIPNNKTAAEMSFGKHPTQKPLSVCKRIIALTSKPGDVVLAPFGGAGSECVAAKELGRNYLGFEMDQQYVDIAEKRLQATHRQDSLFS